MREYPNFKRLAWTVVVALGGGVLYIPAAIGLGVAALLRRPEPEDDGWRFTLAEIEDARNIAVTCGRKTDLWAQMNLGQYFTVVPGATAIAAGYCAFSRPVSAHA